MSPGHTVVDSLKHSTGVLFLMCQNSGRWGQLQNTAPEAAVGALTCSRSKVSLLSIKYLLLTVALFYFPTRIEKSNSFCSQHLKHAVKYTSMSEISLCRMTTKEGAQGASMPHTQIIPADSTTLHWNIQIISAALTQDQDPEISELLPLFSETGPGPQTWWCWSSQQTASVHITVRWSQKEKCFRLRADTTLMSVNWILSRPPLLCPLIMKKKK